MGAAEEVVGLQEAAVHHSASLTTWRAAAAARAAATDSAGLAVAPDLYSEP